jgi:hypothetical protein
MAISYKVLGQSAPSNTSNANLYTVPAGTETIVSTITVTNVTSVSALGEIYVRINGATAANSNAIVMDTVFPGKSLTTLTLGLTLSAGDILTVQTATANALTFQAFGSEIS